MIGKAIYSILANDSDVSVIVGTKITPQKSILAKNLPYIVFSIIDVEPTNTKDGVSNLDVVYFDVNCVTDNETNQGYSTLDDLATKVRTALDRYSGTVEGNNIQSIYYIDEKDMFNEVVEVHFRTLSFKLRLQK